jgi:hypothetical protein
MKCGVERNMWVEIYPKSMVTKKNNKVVKYYHRNSHTLSLLLTDQKIPLLKPR